MDTHGCFGVFTTREQIGGGDTKREVLVEGDAFLTPVVSARKTLRLMNTNHIATFRTGPPGLFGSNELP